ncbi:glucose-1-phosphate adenylyltransferase [Allobaculum stercoricanis]|uniref:glucose-1-phosphate adenylyltransferase n=1 Tax=Allobaculum stercoricanis TaxID=174709 RepID=UPI00036642F3|nr:glucose-1-phosphate adenylyltransferase [Allobaculum stercoricanis]
MENNKMLAMILAGGRGTRLYDLTNKTAKPAVYFGGKYRIIDFPLSNCANSNINVVGVLTQYEPVELNAYAGAGQRWGLDTRGSGVYVLPPSEKDGTKFGVYQGTADAINQNIDFIDEFNPQYVLILSGDHIYKMDYDKMLTEHRNNAADLTVAVRPVPWEEAPRFGIMNTDMNNRILEFQEKPAEPKSNLASMGIYIFDWPLLRQTLIEDAQDENSEHDFGKNIIPNLLNQQKRLFAYNFNGYWKDVGTVDSLWEANMDLINHNDQLDLGDKEWKIYTADIPTLPQYVSRTGKVEHCYINQGAIIRGHVKDSVLFNGVTIDEGAEVIESVLMPGTVVEKGAKVYRAILAEKVKIGANAVVGSPDSKKIELVAADVKGEE